MKKLFSSNQDGRLNYKTRRKKRLWAILMIFLHLSSRSAKSHKKCKSG